MKKHYREVDIIKGIAIAMVLLGHSIIIFPIDLNQKYPWCNYLHWFVSSAHMPLFFAISGFLFSFHDWKSYLAKKSRRLIVPLITFGLLGIFVGFFFKNLINGSKSPVESLIGIFTGSSTWFLYTLFLIFLIFPFVKGVFTNPKTGIVLICGLGILQFFAIWPSLFDIDRVVKYIFYFAIGYFFKIMANKQLEEWKGFIELIRKPLVWGLTLVIWIPLVFVLIATENRSYFGYILVSIITALVGMVNVISFGLLIAETKVSNLFEETGKVSLQLFLFNGYFLTLTRTFTVKVLHINSPVIIIAANFVVMYFVSFALIHFVVKRVKLFRVLTGMV